jgi:hypothetical protein
MDYALFEDSIGGTECRFYVSLAGGEFVSNIVAKIFVDNWAAVRSCFDIHHHGQLFVIDHYQVDRITRDVGISGDDGSNWMTDKANLLLCEHSIVWHLQPRKRAGARHWPNFLGNVLTGVNRDDAWRFQGLGCIYAVDERMSIYGPDESNVESVR